MRITSHPILGGMETPREVSFTFDGKAMSGFEGEPVAAALKAAGVAVHRYTKKQHRPRGVFCAIGRCTDCVMIINGYPNVRACVTPLAAGMTVKTQHGAGGEG